MSSEMKHEELQGEDMDNEKIPDVLYKYYPSEESWEYLFKKRTIRFTPLNEFNDPFEGKPSTNLIFDSIESAAYFYRKSAPKIAANKLLYVDESFMNFLYSIYKYYCGVNFIDDGSEEELRKKLFSAATKLNGAFCMTKNVDNILMWSHYADSHKGFIIGFYTNEILNAIRRKAPYADMPIYYSEDRPILSMENAIDDGNPLTYWKVARDSFFTKSIIWEYEEEWRILIGLAGQDDKAFRVNPVQKISPNAVSCVIFGMAMSESKILQKCREIKQSPSWGHVLLKRAVLHNTKYELEIVDISERFYEK